MGSMILTAFLLCIYFNEFWIYTGFRCSKCRYRKYTLSIYFVKCQLGIPGFGRLVRSSPRNSNGISKETWVVLGCEKYFGSIILDSQTFYKKVCTCRVLNPCATRASIVARINTCAILPPAYFHIYRDLKPMKIWKYKNFENNPKNHGEYPTFG